MKRKLFYGLTIIMIFLVGILINVKSYGALTPTTSMLSAAEGWDADTSSGLVTSTQKIMATAINVIRVVGTGIAIIMITYVAIKYMSAAPQEKAEFKKSAVALIVGAIVLFAGTNILTIIAKFASSNIS